MRDEIDRRIEQWRTFVLRQPAVDRAELEEYEARLRRQVDDLEEPVLDADETLLIAMHRIHATGASSPALTRVQSKWLGEAPAPKSSVRAENGWRREALVAIGLAAAAAVTTRIPELFGLHINDTDGVGMFYVRNFGFFVLPYLAVYFAWKRALGTVATSIVALAFAAGLVVMNLYPFAPGGDTQVLSSLHMLVALWLTVGFAYCGGRWQEHDRRMDFVRFSGDWFVQYVLIALGGGVLMLSTAFIFSAIGLNPENFLLTWILPCGVAGAVIIAAWLVEAWRGIVGHIVPVLTMVFTPLFTLVFVAFLGTVFWTRSGVSVERELLIGFDLLLVLVLGLHLYALASRDPQREPGFFDALQLFLLLCALLADALVLRALLGRISTFGFSPNRVAGLGLNILLLVNLGWAAVLYLRFIAGKAGLASLLRWQTTYLPVYAAWAWVVAALFPPLFRFS